MQVSFHEQTLARIRQISSVLGVEEEKIIQRAVLYYLDAVQKQHELKNEINEWDRLGDEALANFEKSNIKKRFKHAGQTKANDAWQTGMKSVAFVRRQV